MGMEILSRIFSTLLCPECSSDNLELIEINSEKKGAASALTLTCNCGYEKQFYISPRVKHGKAFNINCRLVYSMRSCDVGYNGLELSSNLMNMPSAMLSKAHDDIVKKLSDSCEKIAEKSMNDGATEIHDLSKSSDSVVNTNISLDGNWQKRGYSSLNGYVAALSMESGKVLDIEVMSRFCRLCDANKNLEKN